METEKCISNRKQSIATCYEELFPSVALFIRRRGGNLEDAKEIFQEALMRFYEKSSRNDFQVELNDNAYLMGIVKNLWFKSHRAVQFDPIETVDAAEEVEKEPLTEKLLRFLEVSGQKCMELLQSFYFEKRSMGELSKRFGYKSERSATVQKFKCLEKVRDQVKQKSLEYEDFIS